MVLVDGGTLSSDNQLNGTVVDTFYTGKYAVTWGEWQEVRTYAMANGYDIGTRGVGCADDHPVHSLIWYDVVKWCNAKSELEGLSPVYTVSGEIYRSGQSNHVVMNAAATGYRLPLEAEWEYAARGGNHTNGYLYSGSDDLNEVGWYLDNSGGAACPFTQGTGTWPVGLKAANEFGLYDMSGNVSEWCWDWVRGYEGIHRHHRCGSADRQAGTCIISSRYFGSTNYYYYFHGFRLVRSSED